MHRGIVGILGLLVGLAALAGVAMITTAGVAVAGGSSHTSTPTWTIDPTPNAGQAEVSDLASVACPARRTCIAVGSSAHLLSSPTRNLAESWNGRLWSIQKIPTPKGTSDTLFGVACASARACMTVGSAYNLATHRQATLAEVWNGGRWRVQGTPRVRARDASLHSVACPSRTSCWAVGWANTGGGASAIVERWNGNTWRQHAVPRRAKHIALEGVSCSGPRTCSAVGYSNARPVALTWNRKNWRAHSMALPPGALEAEFDAVSCSSARACMATGTYINQSDQGPTFAERWNGKSWRVEPTPNPADWTSSLSDLRLDGVSCTSADACTATGFYFPGHSDYFVESWNGTSWQLEPVPHPSDFTQGALLGISCARTRCAAVGAYTNLLGLQVTLTTHADRAAAT